MNPQEWKIWNQAPNAEAIAAGIKDIPALLQTEAFIPNSDL